MIKLLFYTKDFSYFKTKFDFGWKNIIYVING